MNVQASNGSFTTADKLLEAFDETFLSFTKQCSEVETDKKRWELALKASLCHHKVNEKALCRVGQVVHTVDHVLYVLPALLDLELLPGDVYITAIALYLFHVQHSADTVLIDTRAGSKDWPNMSVMRMIRWIRNISRILPRLYDAQIRILLFPVPAWGIRLFNLVSSNHLRETMIPIPRQDTEVNAPFPMEQLGEYIEPCVLDTIETLRESILRHPFPEK